ncbi:MAG: hypothetical protein IAE78_05220 [Myxococcus sp.]|nr:hypothetical protein [Myxococcus sp.]
MRCEDAELKLLENPDAEVLAHARQCASCQGFMKDLSLVTAHATLPAPTPAQRAALDGLAEATWSQWRRAQRRQRSWLGYAAAAGFGALVASAGFWSAGPVREVVVERVVEAPADAAGAEVKAGEPNLAALEVFFDVTWPETLEGDAP